MMILKRQFILNAEGQPIGVILPVEEYDLVSETLEQRLAAQQRDEQLLQMEIAAADPLFLADLRDTMDAFGHTDADWWEHTA